MQHTYFTPQEVAGQGTKRFKCPIHGGSKRSVAVGYIDGNGKVLAVVNRALIPPGSLFGYVLI